MRRAIVTTAATTAGVVMLLSLKPHDAQSASAQTPITSAGASTSSTTSSSTSSTSKAKAASASYTGTAVDTRYGPVQVRITVNGGKISTVDVLQYPSGMDKDQQINSYALPILNKEALSAQSSQIDMVSGATYTSTGYIQSLQSALDQAGLK